MYSKQTSIEIEQLNARVVEAETKLKSEVQRIKKKLQIQITELEMSLDVANHTNIELQKTIKRQSAQLTEIQAHYEEIQRQLQSTVDQYGIAQRRIQSLTGELEEIRVNYDSSLRSKRQVEVQLEEASTRINDLTVSNASYASLRTKLEQELTVLASDYEEVSRELRVSDERYQKVQVRSIFYATPSMYYHPSLSLFSRLNSSTPLNCSTKNRKELSRLKPSRSPWKSKSR